MVGKQRLQLIRVAGAIAAGGALLAGAVSRAAPPPASPARYAADGRMEYPADYRSWVYLSTGLDMSYTDRADDPGMHMFDSVFVDRAAYEAFQKTGTWPDKTVLVLEGRRGAQKGSINNRGLFQTEKMGNEAHVKDEARFKDTGGWAFFAFSGEGPGTRLPAQAGCQACHQAHGAVDTTFVQFYPTLLPKAQQLRTLSAAYLKDESAAGVR